MTSSPDAMLELDSSGTVLQLNPAARAFLTDVDLGEQFLSLVPPELQSLASAHLQRPGSAPSRVELTLRDGRTVEAVTTPLDGNSRLVVLRDVTRRRRDEEELVQAARLETAGTLLGGVAHDFNNLLGTLLGHVGLLRLTVAEEHAKQRLERMEHAIERASLITRRLLAIGGRSEQTATHLDLAPLLTEVADIVEPALPEHVELRTSVPKDLPRIHASAEDLRHVLLNLVLNARDAVGETGLITIDAVKAGNDVQLMVSDSGPGVPQELRERIFEPFFTTKGPDRGTGLGLPMARRLVRQHGGQLELAHGPRACFVLTLPTASEPSPPIRHTAGARVAVVDDEADQAALFANALTLAGYQVECFDDSRAALAALATRPPQVLVTDVVMPGMSGLELASALRELTPSLPVVIVSGYVPSTERPLSGQTEHLDKPVRAERVVTAVGRLLGS